MDDKQPKYNTRRVLARYKFIGFLFGFFGLVILLKAAYLMTVDRDYWLAVNAKFESEYKPLPATRGNILSADGQLLATSLPEYRIFLDPMSWERDSVKREKDQKRRDSILTHCMDSIVNGMHQIIPDLDPQTLRRRIIEGRRKKKHNIALYSQNASRISNFWS